MAARSYTQRLILDALAQVEVSPVDPPHRVWTYRHRHSFQVPGLSTRIDSLHRERKPEARNRPSYRHVQDALRALVREGLVAFKEAEGGEGMYRLTEQGLAEAGS